MLDKRPRGLYNTFMDASTRQAVMAAPPKTCVGATHTRASSALLLVGASEAVRLGLGDSDCWLCWACYAPYYAPSPSVAEALSEPQHSEPVVTADIGEWHTSEPVREANYA